MFNFDFTSEKNLSVSEHVVACMGGTQLGKGEKGQTNVKKVTKG